MACTKIIDQVLVAANGSRYVIENIILQHLMITRIQKYIYIFFYLIRFLRSGQKTKRRASAPGCKWLELHHRFCQLVVLRYHTNSNLFLKFFYHLRFLRSDWHKSFPPVSGEKKEKKEKKMRPKKWKVGETCWNAPKKILSAFRQKKFVCEQNQLSRVRKQ